MSAVLQNVEIDFIGSEVVTRNSKVSNKELENDEVVTDTITNDPRTINLIGEITKEAPEKLSIIEGYRDNKQIVSYAYRNVFARATIKNFVSTHNVENVKGFTFTMTLQEVKTVGVRRVEISPSILAPKRTPSVTSKPITPFLKSENSFITISDR